MDLELLDCKSSLVEYEDEKEKINCKLCILVFACAIVEKYKTQIDGILQTWGLLCDKENIPFFIFVGKNIDEYKDNTHIVSLEDKGVKDDYLSASYKQYIGMQWILSRYDPEFLCIVGSDTWVSGINMLNMLKSFDCNQAVYIGRGLYVCNILRKTIHMHSGGAGMVISREGLKRLRPYLYGVQKKWIELISKYYYPLHIYIPACDVSLSLLCNLLEMKLHIEFKMYEHNFKTQTDDYDNVITSHLMGLEECLEYYEYLTTSDLS